MYHRLLLPFAALGTVVVLTLAASTPIPVHAATLEAWGEAGEASPFELEILHAELTEDGTGDPKLKLDYRIHNVSEELIAAVAWALDVRNEGGETVASASGSFEVILEPGQSVERSMTFGSSFAKLVPSNALVAFIAAGGSHTVNGICVGSATTEEEACSNWEFACEASCGAYNDLIVGPGVQAMSCGSCDWYLDPNSGCYAYTCHGSCVCNYSDFPPHLPAGPGPWEADPSSLPTGVCGEPVNENEGFFFFRF